VVGQSTSSAAFKGTIAPSGRLLAGEDAQVGSRPSHVPFTEPSIEVDVDWPKDDPEADRLTKGTGWLEIIGAGMVHPTVLRNGGYHPARGRGFAFRAGGGRPRGLRCALGRTRPAWGDPPRVPR